MYGHSSLISLADSVALLQVVKGRYKRPIYAMNCTTESAIYVMELWLQNGESKGIEMLNANSVTSELTYFIQILHPLLSYENLYY